MDTVKRPMTNEQLVETLKRHGCEVHDINAAVAFLSHVGYYRFTGYLLPFKKLSSKDTKCHTEYYLGTSFERIKAIYDFDQQIRGILTYAIGEIEISLRTVIANHHAFAHGSLGYMYSRNFLDLNEHSGENGFLSRFNKEIESNHRNKVVTHHKEHYGGNFPIWVAVNFFTFSMLSKFYSNMLREDQEAIARKFLTNKEYLSSWLYSISILRNSCAHYERLYACNFSAVPKLPKSETWYSVNRHAHSLFVRIFVLKLLFCNYCEDNSFNVKWKNDILAQIIALMDKYGSHINYRHIGFPDRWKEVLLK